MIFSGNGVAPTLSSHLFAILSARTGAHVVHARDGRLTTNGAPRPYARFHEDTFFAVMEGAFEEPTLRDLWGALSSGILDGLRYEAKTGAFTGPNIPEGLNVTTQEVIDLQYPLSLELRRPPAANPPHSVRLTVPWPYWSVLNRIHAPEFRDAAFRVLGHRDPSEGDILHLHADGASILPSALRGALRLSREEPSKEAMTDNAFPDVPLRFHRAAWIYERDDIAGSPAAVERVVDVLKYTRWARPDTPASPAPVSRHPKANPTKEKKDDALVAILSDLMLAGPRERAAHFANGMIALTKAGIDLGGLALIPKHVFDEATRHGLGRKPCDGDEIYVIADLAIKASTCTLKEAVLLAVKIPRSRQRSTALRLRYCDGKWHLIPSLSGGDHVQRLSDFLLTRTSWGILR